MIRKILYKWFGIEEDECKSCETLKLQLEIVNREKELLLSKLLTKDEPIIKEPPKEIERPIQIGKNRYIPSIVRQQMMDREDRRSLELMQKHNKERDEAVRALEKELNVEEVGEENASEVTKTV